MGKYRIEYDHSKKISPNTVITMIDTNSKEEIRFTKKALRRGFPIEYNQEMSNALFETDPLFYKWIPMEYRTDEMTIEMMEKFGAKLYEYYPVKFRTKEMTTEYIRHTGSHLYYVPEEQMDEGICDLYAMANPCGLREIPEEYRKEKYIENILRRGYHLGVVPYEERTIDVCMKFIKSDSSNIEFVPDEILEEICSRVGLIYSKTINLPNNNHWMMKNTK